MTYFETVIICRGMPSGLDQHDPINLCFGLEEALSCLFSPLAHEMREDTFYFISLLALRLETRGGVFGKYSSLGSAFPISVCAEHVLVGDIRTMEQQSPPLFVAVR